MINFPSNEHVLLQINVVGVKCRQKLRYFFLDDDPDDHVDNKHTLGIGKVPPPEDQFCKLVNLAYASINDIASKLH